ncbi:MAG: redox-regulated ATPase YchF [Myxococcota bacterium]
MGFKCGIVGLPNVGKSTLFNALTSTKQAEAANYPFCTIEPNTGRVSVPDPRLYKLAEMAGSAKIIPTQIEIVDIAGLVRGASKGEGLGNQFLANIRETDAIIHVLRCFEGEVTHVEGSVDPIRDAETVETELLLSDLESLERRVKSQEKRAKVGEKEAKAGLELMQRVLVVLGEGKPARAAAIAPDEQKAFQELQLITSKPVLYVANVDEAAAASGNAHSERVKKMAEANKSAMVVISAEIESQVAVLPTVEEKLEFLSALGLTEPGLNRVIRAGYGLLGLLTFFTVGPKEARAWTVHGGATAPEAAGVIHTDFQRGFIKAETIDYDSYVKFGSEAAARDAGKLRQEGKTYLVQDGDIFHFKFNV